MRLSELERLYQEATPGRWYMDPPLLGPQGGVIWAETPDGDILPLYEIVEPYPQGDYNPQESAELTVALHNAFPELLQWCRDARERLELTSYRWHEQMHLRAGNFEECSTPDCKGARALLSRLEAER